MLIPMWVCVLGVGECRLFRADEGPSSLTDRPEEVREISAAGCSTCEGSRAWFTELDVEEMGDNGEETGGASERAGTAGSSSESDSSSHSPFGFGCFVTF